MGTRRILILATIALLLIGANPWVAIPAVPDPMPRVRGIHLY